MALRLAYLSSSTLPSDREQQAIAQILETSRRNNEADGITGALLVTEHRFAQVLEGERDPVQQVYARIATDPRHRNLLTILIEPIKERQFAEWSMAFIGPSQAATQAIASVTGTFSKSETLAARGLITFMREVLTGKSRKIAAE